MVDIGAPVTAPVLMFTMTLSATVPDPPLLCVLSSCCMNPEPPKLTRTPVSQSTPLIASGSDFHVVPNSDPNRNPDLTLSLSLTPSP